MASTRRRWAALTSGALLVGGLVAGPALVGASTASAAPVTLGYTCTLEFSGHHEYDSTLAIDLTAPGSVAPDEKFTASFTFTLDMGAQTMGPVQSLSGDVDLNLSVGGGAAVTVNVPVSEAPPSNLKFTGSGTAKLTAPATEGATSITVGDLVGHFTANPYNTDVDIPCAPDAGQDQTIGSTTVAVPTGPPIATSTEPTVSGQPVVGKKLTVTDGSYDPADVTVSYQWLRAGDDIAGATAASYTPVPSDLGKSLSVQVTASKPDHISAVNTVEAGTVAAGKVPVSGTAKVTGTAKVGKTLTAVPGKAAGAKISYQWLSNGSPVKKATKATMKLTKAVKGTKVSVKVTYAKAGYDNTVQTTKAVTVK